MKTLVASISLVVVAFSGNAQISSTCIIDPMLQTNYEKDVKHLAYQRIVAQNSVYKDSIIISQSFQDTIWEGMAAIYNLTSIAERDSVFDNYCIHQDIKIITNNIYVGVDPNYSWTQNWQSLNTATGIAAMDNMLAQYGFTVTYYSSFANYARLTTAQNINVQPICDSLQSFGGVLYSEPELYAGDGNRIEYSKTGSERFYSFSVGYGDCPAGCTSRRIFNFKVYNNCSVDYLGTTNFVSGNDVMPGPINCNISVGEKEPVKQVHLGVYPNPSNGEFEIVASGLNSREILFSVINVLGQEVVSERKIVAGNEIILKYDLNPGTYLLRAVDVNTQQVLTGDLLIVK